MRRSTWVQHGVVWRRFDRLAEDRIRFRCPACLLQQPGKVARQIRPLRVEFRRSPRGLHSFLRPALALQHASQLLARQGEVEAAIEQARQAVMLRPQLPGMHGHLSHLLARADRLDEAEAAIRQMIELAPENPGGHQHLSHLP
jgi:predicted Zn-dependent protease